MSILKAIFKNRGEGTASLTNVDTDDQGGLCYGTTWDHTGNYFFAATSITNKQLMAFSWNGTTITHLQDINLGSYSESISYHPTTEFLASGNGTTGSQLKVHSWNGSTTLTEVESVDVGGRVIGVAWHPGGNYLAVGTNNASKDIIIYSWNGTDTLTEVTYLNLSGTGSFLSWNPAGTHIALSNADSSKELIIISWNGTDTLAEVTSANLGGWSYNNCWSKDGNFVFTGGSDTTKTVIAFSWNGSTLTERAYKGYGSTMYAMVAMSKAGSYLIVDKDCNATRSTDKWIYMYAWDPVAYTLTETTSLTFSSLGCFGPSVSPNNKYIASGHYYEGAVPVTVRVESTNLR